MSFSSSSYRLTTPHPSHLLGPQDFSTLHSLNSCKSTQELKQIHSYMIKTSPIFQTHLVCTKILSLCAKFPDVDPSYVNSVFAQISNPGAASNSYTMMFRLHVDLCSTLVIFAGHPLFRKQARSLWNMCNCDRCMYNNYLLWKQPVQ